MSTKSLYAQMKNLYEDIISPRRKTPTFMYGDIRRVPCFRDTWIKLTILA
jgi:hypothetical protein